MNPLLTSAQSCKLLMSAHTVPLGPQPPLPWPLINHAYIAPVQTSLLTPRTAQKPTQLSKHQDLIPTPLQDVMHEGIDKKKFMQSPKPLAINWWLNSTC